VTQIPLKCKLTGAASWSRVERIIARVEAGADGPDTRFVVTNWEREERDFQRRRENPPSPATERRLLLTAKRFHTACKTFEKFT
jgi:hypothetical protein